MNMKDRMIKKLLDFGKKHKLLVYPVLVLVAIISAISNLIYRGRTEKKRTVAGLMIVVMLITQSLIMTTSASGGENDVDYATATDAEISGYNETIELETDLTIRYYKVDDTTIYDSPISTEVVSLDADSNTYIIPDNSVTKAASVLSVPEEFRDNFEFEIKHDSSFTEDYPSAIAADSEDISDDMTYDVYVRATRVSYPITIYNSLNETEILYSYDASVLTGGATLVRGDSNPAFSITVPDVGDEWTYRFGYTYNGLQFGTSQYELNSTISITPTDTDTGFSMYAQWTGMQFDVIYDLDDGEKPSSILLTGDETFAQNLTYGEEITLPSNADISTRYSSEAYYLSGWKCGDNTYEAGATVSTSVLCSNNESVSDEMNITGNTLTAIWAYKDTRLKIVTNSGDGVTTIDSLTGNLTIEASYGDDISFEMAAEYKTDGTEGTGFSYSSSTEITNAFGGYGLNITQISNGTQITKYKIEGSLNNITAGETISITVTDTNKPEGQQDSIFTITLVSNKREVSIDQTTIFDADTITVAPTKEYDGTSSIGIVGNSSVTNRAEADINSDVYVTFDTTAMLDDCNAGQGKGITLSNVVLTGTKAGYYILSDISSGETSVDILNIATVTRKNLSVVVSLVDGEAENILFGEDTPQYTIRLVDSSLLAVNDRASYESCVTDSEYMLFMTNMLGFEGWSTQRTIYSPATNYTISPSFNDSSSNYSVSASGITKTFVVGRETGEGNYQLSSDPIEGYYPGLSISGINGYTKVRILGLNDVDISNAMSEAEAEALFDDAGVAFPDMVDQTIRFQMLNPTTGAITEIVTLEGISVDTSGPELLGYELSIDRSYFNEFGFGSYYHAQIIDGVLRENVSITFMYDSESQCDELWYMMVDESGNLISRSSVSMEQSALGYYTGTISIGTATNGQLIVYATDTTGNSSARKKIKLNEAIDYVLSAENASTYYEWMIENSIDSAEIQVTDIAQNPITSNSWYNGIILNVSAADDESGVQKIVWHIKNPDGEIDDITEIANDSNLIVASTNYGKVQSYTFKTQITSGSTLAGEYTIGATLYDNAGNSVDLAEKGPYYIDCVEPDIELINDIPDEYISSFDLDFTVTDGSDESGVDYVILYKTDGDNLNQVERWSAAESYHYEINDDGTYIIMAWDVAGNCATEECEFEQISNVNPVIPVIRVTDGEEGSNGWYKTSHPQVTISSSSMTSDNVPVKTYYSITTGSVTSNNNFDEESEIIAMSTEGTSTISAYAKSESGCISTTATLDIKIDTTRPQLYISDSQYDTDGNQVISFRVTDTGSGVDETSIMINGEPVEVVNNSGVCSGSFIVDDESTYVIEANDIAGNSAEELNFDPLRLDVMPIMDITEDSAYIEASVYEGTYPVNSFYIEYKRAAAASYTVALASTHSESYGSRLTYTFNNLAENTVYDYRVYASTETSSEVKIVEGSFKTTDTSALTSIQGDVSYDDELDIAYTTYPIYVSLYEGNTYIATKVIEDDTDLTFSFSNITDGTYILKATNGMLTKIESVNVTNGGVSYPDNYASNNGISLVLSGLSTDVIIESNDLAVSVDGLEDIYNIELYNGNVTEEDMNVVTNGGMINILMHVSVISVENVDPTALGVLTERLGESEIKEYILITITKEVRDANGRLVNNTPKQITRLIEPLRISIELNETIDNLGIASVHQENSSYSFINWDSEDIEVADNVASFSTDRFSIFALYEKIIPTVTYTVKWVDGNGNIMKTENVEESNSATPPTQVPTKSATKNYTYTFAGWDQTYSNVTGDMIIAATFTAKPIVITEEPTIEKPLEPTTTEKPSVDDPTTEQPLPDDTKVVPPDSNSDGTTEPTRYNYLGSAESPQTGDKAPIALVLFAMVVSGAGIIVKKKKNI